MQIIFLLFTILASVILTFSNAQDSNDVKAQGEAFLLEVSKRENIKKLKSGMLIEILETSNKEDAKSPTFDDASSVTYSGSFIDGTEFEPPTTYTFAANEVIPGWAEAMQLMVEGDKWRLYLPYNLAYGERGYPELQPPIPAFSALVFELDMHWVNNTGKSVSDARAKFEESLMVAEPEL